MKTNEKYGAYEAPRVGGTKMKKLLFITYIAALAALVGCQQDDELHTDPIPYVTFSASEEQTMVIHEPESFSVEIFCSVNDGDWEDIGDKGYSITFGGAHGDLRLRATSEIGTSNDDGNYKISFENETPVACTGDIRTLVDWENYATANTENAKFYQLFRGCTQLVSAPELPATTLAESCYYMMFNGCTSLTTAPALPATTLTPSCYNMMFRGCTQLTSAPELPATSLANNCYDMMFYGCKSLATAPVLPATTLAESCYQNMFRNCTSLNSITMLATDISAFHSLTNWVDGVAATGTFTKAKDVSIPINSPSGIPEGWTVKSYVDPDVPSGGGW